jgi:hypothetical protein
VRFASTSALDAGVERSPEAEEQFANVLLGLAVGLPMLKLIEPAAVAPGLLGSVLSLLIRTLESNPGAREDLAAAGRSPR